MRRPREEVIRSGLPFRLTYILDELLLDHPDVRIAVHSSWRQLLPDREVCGYLGPLSERFICSTVQGDRWPSILQSVALLKPQAWIVRSEEHTSELQSLMRISYAVFCLKKKKQTTNDNTTQPTTAHKR